MSINNQPFREIKVEDDGMWIKCYGKKDATWDQMSAFLEKMWGKDPAMCWRGFGKIGTEDFVVLIHRKRGFDDSDDEDTDSDDEDE